MSKTSKNGLALIREMRTPKSSQRFEDTSQIVAIKKMAKSLISQNLLSLDYLLNEIRVHWALTTCTSVVKLLQLYEDAKAIYMVLEYQPKGTLMHVMSGLKGRQSFSEAQARVIIEQLLLALDFFQKKKIIHRDLKLDNILISSEEDPTHFDIRIADFGLAVITPNDEQLT